ncbi:MAG: YhbY family RNA-binding protein [Ruminococcus sp.]|jgi:RNA-binding protein|nr:YhbY family RNA-binding protein [Ruminococcus sp.]
MLTSKQRSFLKSLAQNEDTIITVGKNGVNDEVIYSTACALAARELIKGKVLETSPEPLGDVAAKLSEKTRSELVHTIGGKFVLYKRNHKNPKIELPKKGKTHEE